MINKKQDTSHCHIILLSTYLLGALITNSYVRIYRWADWKQQHTQRYEDAGYDKYAVRNEVCLQALMATGGWPIYWAAKITDQFIGAFNTNN